MKRLSALALGILLVTRIAAAQSEAASVGGTVSVMGADGIPVVLPGVTVTLTCPGSEPKVQVSDDQGQFHFDAVDEASCELLADLQGFKSATKDVTLTAGQASNVDVALGLDTLREEVTVTGRVETNVGASEVARVQKITADMIQTAPLASERFQDALPLIPGVVRGPDGLLNINGARSNQAGLTFDSANGTDPVTGEDAIEPPIDAVSSIQVRGAAYAPEYGLSAGALTSIETQRAGDAWHLTVNDLEPRLRRRAGEFRGIESWTPRFTVGGPVVKDRFSVIESVQYEYSQTRVFGLPAFQSDTKLETFESFTGFEWAASPTNRVSGSAMFSPRNTTYAGLNTFNPQPVTSDIHNHNALGTIGDQIIVGGEGLLDSRLSVKQFDSRIFPSVGRLDMVLAPDNNSGSYFNDQDRTSQRVDWLTTYSFTPIGPAHLIKVGAGVTHERFDGTSVSRPVDIVRENGTLNQRITFVGDGSLGRGRSELHGFTQDSWTVSPWLTVQYGARYDYDSFTGDVNAAPRGSFTALASADGRTVVRGGVGVFYDPITLNVASFDELQERAVSLYDLDGVELGPAVIMPNVVASPLHTPRGVNWNIEVDREWLKNFFVRVSYRQRNNRFEPVVDPSVEDGQQVLLLKPDGRSDYHEGQITARYVLRSDSQIVGSYTRSSAVGNLNDFNSFFGNIENPVIRPDARGPLPWDAPNRYLFWSNLALPRGYTVFPLLDVRTGFPFSIVDESRNFVGARNEAGRYPTFVSLDMQVSKRLRVLGHDATIGLKVFNVTNHFNPRDFQGNLASAELGGFSNSVGRTFRGRWIFEF